MTCEAQSLHAVALLVLAIWYQSIYLLPKLEYNAVHPYTRWVLIPSMFSEELLHRLYLSNRDIRQNCIATHHLITNSATASTACILMPYEF